MRTVWVPPIEEPPAFVAPRQRNKVMQAAEHNGNKGRRVQPPRKDNSAPNARILAGLSDGPTTPLGHLQVALRDTDLAKRQLGRMFQDPSAELHGNLIVALGALRRASAAVEKLVAIEEANG